jgi:large subunit ribosomal protein L29e
MRYCESSKSLKQRENSFSPSVPRCFGSCGYHAGMTKSNLHTTHKQSWNYPRSDIRKPWSQRYDSLKEQAPGSWGTYVLPRNTGDRERETVNKAKAMTMSVGGGGLWRPHSSRTLSPRSQMGSSRAPAPHLHYPPSPGSTLKTTSPRGLAELTKGQGPGCSSSSGSAPNSKGAHVPPHRKGPCLLMWGLKDWWDP